MNLHTTLIITLLALLYFAATNLLTTRYLERLIVTSQQSTIDALVAQLQKAHTEIVDRLNTAHDDIAAQLAGAGVAAETVDLSALTAIAQALDDLTPDPVVDAEEDDVEVDDETDADEETDEEILEETVEEAEETADEETK